MKTYKGKAIYTPTGKAQEYAPFACNFYVGCSNGCKYCFLKKGIGKKTLGGDFPTLKTCFKDKEHALTIFKKELLANLEELQKHGLFFSFTTDPMLAETIDLTKEAIALCVKNNVNVIILTKRTDFFQTIFGAVTYAPICNASLENIRFVAYKESIAFGFTLTGCDDLEPDASSNQERIQALKDFHQLGFKTWASIEPVVDIDSSLAMVGLTIGDCDLYKIGLESGKKYDKKRLRDFISDVCRLVGPNAKIYFKETLLKKAEISRFSLPDNCVGSDYNLFNNK